VVGSLVYFGLAMVAELYPSGPTYQLALAAILLYLHAFDDNSPSVRGQICVNEEFIGAHLLGQKRMDALRRNNEHLLI